MHDYGRFGGAEPSGTIVVRLVSSPNGTRAFIRQVSDPNDIAEASVEQSEEMPVEEALILANNKAANIDGGAAVVVELGSDTIWDRKWGRLM